MNVIFTGDVFLKDRVPRVQRELNHLFDSVDYGFINLEAPILLGDYQKPIDKSGPNLSHRADIISKFIKDIGINCVTLGNNHIRDFGSKGIMDTLNFCGENSILNVGAGLNIEKASESLILESKDMKIAVINVAENEWCSSSESRAGSHPLDIITTSRKILNEKRHNDHVIVVIHGGLEHYSLPLPDQQTLFRYFIDCGASAVVCHHTHCIGGYELYRSLPIFYGLGNFVFDVQKDNSHWSAGLVLELNFTKGAVSHKLSPTIYRSNDNYLGLLEGKELDEILEHIKNINRIINNNIELRREWSKCIKLKTDEYLFSISCMNAVNYRIPRKVLKTFGIHKLFATKRFKLFMLNIVRCETHRRVLLDVLEEEITP
jgi:poly-gamma-glutamate capsule biosynthesis protein CapA/YwtB (metallophosphatase superfamily)